MSLLTPGMRTDDLRASDADREQVAALLRAAVGEGRLNLTEADERLAATYAARTYGELRRIVRDLPTGPRGLIPTPLASAGQPDKQAKRLARANRKLRDSSVRWLSTGVVLSGIWAADGVDHDYWPAWVLIPYGALIASGQLRRRL